MFGGDINSPAGCLWLGAFISSYASATKQVSNEHEDPDAYACRDGRGFKGIFSHDRSTCCVDHDGVVCSDCPSIFDQEATTVRRVNRHARFPPACIKGPRPQGVDFTGRGHACVPQMIADALPLASCACPTHCISDKSNAASNNISKHFYSGDEVERYGKYKLVSGSL